MQKKLNSPQSTSLTQISDPLVDWEVDLNAGLIHCSSNLMDRAGGLLSEKIGRAHV